MIRWTYEQKRNDLGPTSSGPAGGLAKRWRYYFAAAGSISVHEVMMILQPTVTRCGVRPIAGDTRESSWPMVSQPTKTRRSLLIGLTGCYGKALERNASSCRGSREIVSRLLLPLAGSLLSCFWFLGFGILNRKFASVTVGIYMDNAISGQRHS